jgi:hypothetical protein
MSSLGSGQIVPGEGDRFAVQQVDVDDVDPHDALLSLCVCR